MEPVNAAPENGFEELAIPRQDVAQPLTGRYKVFADAKSYKMVEASSALEALKICGITQAYKVEREELLMKPVLNMQTMLNMEADVSPQPTQAAAPVATAPNPLLMVAEDIAMMAEAAAEKAASTAEAAAPAEPLSNDDIDKLLNG